MKPLYSVLIFLMLCICSSFNQPGEKVLKVADSLREGKKYKEAINAYTVALAGSQKLNARDRATSFARKAYCQMQLLQLDAALSNYFQALYLFDSLRDEKRLAACAGNISNLYTQKGDYFNASRFAHQAYQLYLALNDSLKTAATLNDLGLLAFQQKNTGQAINIHKGALRDFGTIMTPALQANHLLNLGNCYRNSKPDSSLYYWKSAETIILTIDDHSLLPALYNNIADVLKERGKFAESVSYFSKSVQQLKRYENKSDQSIIYHNMSELYDSLKDFKSAYNYSRLEIELDREIFDSSRSKIAAELSAKYDSDKKDQRLKANEIERALRQKYLYAVLGALALAISLLIVIYLAMRRKAALNKKLADINQNILRLNTDLNEANLVKARLFSIIGHDIRAPVSSMYSSLKSSRETATYPNTTGEQDQFLAQGRRLLDTLEDLLIWSESQSNSFSPFKEKISPVVVIENNLLLLHALGVEKKLTINKRFEDEVFIYSDETMFSIVVRNILSNAFRHAIAGTEVIVAVSSNGQEVLFEVENNAEQYNIAAANGESEKTNSFGRRGLGTILIRDFTAILAGKVVYEKNEQSLKVNMRIPAFRID